MDATVEVDVRLPARKMLPWIESVEPGVVVPMPRKPFVPNVDVEVPPNEVLA